MQMPIPLFSRIEVSWIWYKVFNQRQQSVKKEWFQANYMQANPNKCQAIYLDPKCKRSRHGAAETTATPCLKIENSKLNFRKKLYYLV